MILTLQQYTVLFILPSLVFGIPFWIMIFIATYVHFPKMDKANRLEMSISSATILTIVMLLISYLFLVALFEFILK